MADEDQKLTEEGPPTEDGSGRDVPADPPDTPAPDSEAPDSTEPDGRVHDVEQDGRPAGDGGDELDEHESGPTMDDQPGRMVCSQVNVAAIGRMVLHFAARDVVVWLDGDAAMRLLDLYRRRSAAGLGGDRLDPYTSSARNSWVVVDLDQEDLLALSWLPGLPSRPPRTAIDPEVVAA